MAHELNGSEEIVRAALFLKMGAEVIAVEEVIKVTKPELNEQGERYFEISVGRRSMLPNWEHVHDYGCRVAQVVNSAAENRAADRGGQFTRQHYVGSYCMSVEKILLESTDIHRLSVCYHPIGGLNEHCDIIILQFNLAATRS